MKRARGMLSVLKVNIVCIKMHCGEPVVCDKIWMLALELSL